MKIQAKKFQFVGLIFLILSACSPQPTLSSAPTVAPSSTALVVTSTVAPSVAGETLVAQPTPTVGTPIVCVDSAESVEWLRDDVPYDFVNLKSNKPVPPNGYFTMTFTLKNSGTCTWDSSYKIVFESGYRMAQLEKYPVIAEGETVPPGESITIHITMVAPPKTGGHQGIWQLISGNGTQLLKLNVFVKVDKGTYSPPAHPLQLTYKESCSDGFAKVRLSWVDAANNEDGYRVYRDSRMLVQLPANTDSVLDAILGGGGNYTYTVVAFNVAGEGSANLVAEVTPCK
ncbi:hypothetical protein ANAEL_01286 [Anaerolineales bacterium]|nr:hypothetical protein ANAEL_01286 [Anaerolineales bacterium]